MKTFFLSIIFISCFSMALTAQGKDSTELLKAYYSIKDALSADSARRAAEQAGIFVHKIDSSLKVSDTARGILKKLKTNAQKIADSPDIEKQREAFARLSDDMSDFAQSAGNWASRVYRQTYRKLDRAVSWLSDQIDSKNPYTGKDTVHVKKVEVKPPE